MKKVYIHNLLFEDGEMIVRVTYGQNDSCVRSPKFQKQRSDWNKGFIWDLLELLSGRQIQEALELRSMDWKIGEAYEGKNGKATVSYMNCLSRIITGAGKKSRCLSSTDWLGSAMVAWLQGGLTLRYKVAARKCFKNSWGSRVVHRKLKFSVLGMWGRGLFFEGFCLLSK